MADERLPGIPSIDRTIDKPIRKIIEPMREILLALTSGENPAARMRALTDAGVINGFDGGFIAPPDTADFTPPPAPTGLTADGALANIILSWDVTSYKNLAFTEIWRAESNNFSLAQKVGAASDGAAVYVDNVNHTGTWYYWIRYVSVAGVTGPFNGQNGTAATTGVNPSALLELLTGNVASPYFGQYPFLVIPTPTTINGVPVPAGGYIRDAFIANGTISNAKIGNLAVDSAKIADLAVGTAKIADAAISTAKIQNLAVTNAQIANLAVDDAKINNLSAIKITAGDIAAARMSANIVAAATGKFATLSALSASLGTVEIGSNGYLRTAGATSYASGIGIWMGMDAGLYKFRVGNPNGNRLTWDGFNLNVVGGGTFSGSLSAATGTFSGSLTAQTITADNIIGNAVTQSVSATLTSGTSVGVSITSIGRPCLILARMKAQDGSGGFVEGPSVQWELTISGGGMSPVTNTQNIVIDGSNTLLLHALHQPSAGTVTFTASFSAAPSHYSGLAGEIIVIELKK